MSRTIHIYLTITNKDMILDTSCCSRLRPQENKKYSLKEFLYSASRFELLLFILDILEYKILDNITYFIYLFKL